MSTEFSYQELLRQDFKAMIEAVNISDLNKQFLRSRWLDQVLWMDRKSERAQKWYYILRLTAIAGGIIVPALVSLNLNNQAASTSTFIHSFIFWITFAIGLLVAITGTLEEFFHFGERWRHYRQAAEWLKIEGWRFFQLSGPYHQYISHADAFAGFTNRVEEILKHEVDIYISEVMREKPKETKAQ
jgi:hypothetical protein